MYSLDNNYHNSGLRSLQHEVRMEDKGRATLLLIDHGLEFGLNPQTPEDLRHGGMKEWN